MKISVLDGSNYFKGLLLLIRKDNKITSEEHELMTRIGKTLGFEKGFIENAIHELLENRYISITPPLFSSQEIAEKFLKDGLIIAASDSEIHSREKEWLLSVAERNNIEKSWLLQEMEIILDKKGETGRLEADTIKVHY